MNYLNIVYKTQITTIQKIKTKNCKLKITHENLQFKIKFDHLLNTTS